jgi:phosphohistidine swiveling domain-containing protein
MCALSNADMKGIRLPELSDFPVTWDDDEEPTRLWTWDEFHSPLPASTMSTSMGQVTRMGMGQASKETGTYRPGGLRKFFNGYPYGSSTAPEITDEEKVERERRLDVAVGSALNNWVNKWRPGLERDLAHMKSVDLSTLSDARLWETLQEFLGLNSHHWYLHHLLVMPAMTAADRLKKIYLEIMGSEAEDSAHMLLRSSNSKTVQAIEALDALAAGAKASDEVSSVIKTEREGEAIIAALELHDDGMAWLVDFDEYTYEFGYRPGGYDMVFPTWKENPAASFDLIRSRLLSPETTGNNEAELLATRASLIGAARDKVVDDTDLMQKFDAALSLAEDLWPLKEDHSYYIDQASQSIIRITLAEVGRRLVANGTLEQADDIWFIDIEEAELGIKGEAPTGLQSLANERRDLRATNIRRSPPKYLGTAPPDHVALMDMPGAGYQAQDGPITLKGTPASRGEATGIARVILTPDEFGKLNSGNILICRSTAPMWTPLFRVAAALVSEAGGVLSHPAVVAREVGLPAVVGITGVTSTIKDGQTVTVSGTDGLVHIVE